MCRMANIVALCRYRIYCGVPNITMENKPLTYKLLFVHADVSFNLPSNLPVAFQDPERSIRETKVFSPTNALSKVRVSSPDLFGLKDPLFGQWLCCLATC